MISHKIQIKDTGRFGRGYIAIEDIEKDEIVVDWSNGRIHQAPSCLELPKDIKDYAIQCSSTSWIFTHLEEHLMNHSCEPNCGIRGLFHTIAIRNISKGEWLSFDYAMCEDSNWRLHCKCETKSCRKYIGWYGDLNEEKRTEYANYTSDWLKQKYSL